MKIALLTDGIFPYVIGGMQKHSFYLAKYLAKNNIRIDLYHTNKSELDVSKLELFSDEEKKNIRSFVIDFPDFGKLPGHYIRESYEYSCRSFNKLKNNGAYDFIYAKGFSGWNLIENKLKGYSCAPIGVNFHGFEMFQAAPSLKSKLEQFLFFRGPVMFNVKNADYVFSYGGKTSKIISGLGVGNEKVIEIPAGIESDWLSDKIRPTKPKRKFLYVGRYERRKGIEELNKVLRSLINDYDFEFYFVGNIPDSKKIQSAKIIYLNSTSDVKKMQSIYSSSDILVCPSYSEGMPNVILEAMASGLAVIASDVGAVNLLVKNDNGWLMPNSSFEHLKSAMKMALSAESILVDNMKHNAREHIKSFLWEDISHQLIDKLSVVAIHS